MWGRGTAEMLERLSVAFPAAGVSFREAEE